MTEQFRPGEKVIARATAQGILQGMVYTVVATFAQACWSGTRTTVELSDGKRHYEVGAPDLMLRRAA